jgi:hypothetical protein
MHNMIVIDNFETFPEITNMPSSDQRLGSYDHCKLGGAAGNQFWTD